MEAIYRSKWFICPIQLLLFLHHQECNCQLIKKVVHIKAAKLKKNKNNFYFISLTMYLFRLSVERKNKQANKHFIERYIKVRYDIWKSKGNKALEEEVAI